MKEEFKKKSQSNGHFKIQKIQKQKNSLKSISRDSTFILVSKIFLRHSNNRLIISQYHFLNFNPTWPLFCPNNEQPSSFDLESC